MASSLRIATGGDCPFSPLSRRMLLPAGASVTYLSELTKTRAKREMPRRPDPAAFAADDPAVGEGAAGDGARAEAAARYIRSSLVTAVLDIVGDRWTLLLLAALMGGPARFEGLAQRLGIARSTLTQRLGDLGDDGLVERRPYQSNPPRHDYALTARGADTLAILHAISTWDRRWASAGALDAWSLGAAPERKLVCGRCGAPIQARDVVYRPAPGIDREMPAAAVPRRARRNRDSAARAQLLISATDVLGNRSLALVVAVAFFGMRRFSDMARALALAPNVLARRLDDLVGAGVLARHIYQERPRRWQYLLSEKGLDLYPVIVAQIAWADRWLAGPAGPPLRLTHKRCGKSLVPVLAA